MSGHMLRPTHGQVIGVMTDDATPQVHSSDLLSTLDQDDQQFGTGLLTIYLKCLVNHYSGPADDTITTIILTLDL